eukprot:6173912-Pleurochrysis_carterae.AAC.2
MAIAEEVTVDQSTAVHGVPLATSTLAEDNEHCGAFLTAHALTGRVYESCCSHRARGRHLVVA